MLLLRSHFNQVDTVCPDVLFLPGHEFQFGADCWVVLLLPRKQVVDGTGGYVEVDLDSSLPVAIDLDRPPVEPREGGFAKVATL